MIARSFSFFMFSIILVACDDSLTQAEIYNNGVSICASCVDGKTSIKHYGYGEFVIDNGIDSVEELCLGSAISDADIVCKNCRVQVLVSKKKPRVHIKTEWITADDNPRTVKDIKHDLRANRISVRSLKNSEPKPGNGMEE